MADRTETSPQPSIFAQKGEAEPASAVAYVSLRQMQGKPERREDAPDRRAQWGERQEEGNSTDGQDLQRRATKATATDHDGRRHYTPRSGLAIGQQYVPWSPTEKQADAAKNSARARKGSPSVASLSALIRRHQDGAAKAAARKPEPAREAQRISPTGSPVTPSREGISTTPREPEERTAAGPTKVDMSYLSAAGAQGQRPAVAAAPQAKQPPTARQRKIKRKKITVRLEIEQYMQIKDLAYRNGKSQQSVMASAVADYLDKIN